MDVKFRAWSLVGIQSSGFPSPHYFPLSFSSPPLLPLLSGNYTPGIQMASQPKQLYPAKAKCRHFSLPEHTSTALKVATICQIRTVRVTITNDQLALPKRRDAESKFYKGSMFSSFFYDLHLEAPNYSYK
jgi:hypothetical protein